MVEAGQQALERLQSFGVIYIAIGLFILLSVFSVKGAEQLLDLQQRLQDLNAELETEVEALTARFEQDLEELDTLALKPRKTDIDIRIMALAWVPFRENEDGDVEAAWGRR